ncbi:response regulator, partial [Pseudoalteromonas sp. SIMBA_148]
SKLARRQLARSLPEDWDIKVEFALDGVDCIKQIKLIEPEILFLDLNMPEMDGYEVLIAMKEQGLNILTVVVSGDIQPSAHQRVLELGAIDFIQKPCSPEKLASIIEHH